MIKENIRIFLVDDHEVVRDGLRHMLELEPDMEIVGEAGDAREALTQVEMLSPEIVLMDIKMPKIDGIELTQQLLLKWPSCKVIMLTLYDEYLAQAMEAGAKGYLLKDIRREELARAIRQIHQGKIVISENIASKSQIEHEDQFDKNVELCIAQDNNDSGTMLREVQLVINPPFDAVQFARFIDNVEDMLQSSILQMVGSWDGGTAITIPLKKPTPLEDVMSELVGMSEVETTREKPLTGDDELSLLKKANSLPRQRAGPSKIIFVTLKKAQAGKIVRDREYSN